jgi:N-acetylneuraminate synthase
MAGDFLEVNGRRIGPGQPVYMIAEISANHNQDFDQAVALVHLAKESGADAVKLQTYTPDTLTLDVRSEYFNIGNGSLWQGRNLYELYQEAYMPWDWQPRLKEVANNLGMDLFSTAFDPTSIEFLESMNVPIHKIASFEITDIPLIEKIASTGKPLIISTGMASLADIEIAVQTARSAGARGIGLFKCTSAYPAQPEEMNLRSIPHLGETFGCPVGLSDHTLGIAVPVTAVALGAAFIEKHFTRSRQIPGPDSAFSLEPAEFKAMVDAVRVAEKALGTVHYGVSIGEKPNAVFRRSLFVVKDIQDGEMFTLDNVRSIRPGYGLSPRYLKEILGRKAARTIQRGTPLSWDIVQGRDS